VQFLRKVDTIKLFSEAEAWNLFKYAAYGEAVGWTLLIYGILAAHFKFWASGVALAIGGSVHGTIFIAYLIIVLATYSSLGWTRGRAVVGIIISVIPYGTLGFELWVANKRRDLMMQSYRRLTVRGVIDSKTKRLALQLSNSAEWTLPGGDVLLGEKAPEALIRIMLEMTGVLPEIDGQPRIYEHNNSVELLFSIRNHSQYAQASTLASLRGHSLIDEAKFVAQGEAYLSKSLEASFSHPVN
jgi:integral membrane protein